MRILRWIEVGKLCVYVGTTPPKADPPWAENMRTRIMYGLLFGSPSADGSLRVNFF